MTDIRSIRTNRGRQGFSGPQGIQGPIGPTGAPGGTAPTAARTVFGNPTNAAAPPIAINAPTARDLLEVPSDAELAALLSEKVPFVGSPARRRSWVDKLVSHRRPHAMFVRWETGSLQFCWVYPSGKSIYATFGSNADDCQIIQGIYSATHQFTHNIVQQKNYSLRTGTWVDIEGSSYTDSAGATVTLDFLGTGLDVRHYADHCGGRWSFVLDSVSDPYILDTYVSSGGPVLTTRLVSGLPYGQHRLVGTLLGIPNAGNTSGVNRGWLSIGAVDGDSNSTLQSLSPDILTVLSIPLTIKQPSNAEFAIAARASGSTSDLHFLPGHGSGTVFLRPGESYQVIIDGVSVLPGSSKWMRAERAVCIGKYYGKNPDDSNYAARLCEIDVTHTITDEGIQADVDVIWSRACEVLGYSAMFGQGLGTLFTTDLDTNLTVPPPDNVILPGSPWVGSVVATKPNGTLDEKAVWLASDWSDSIDECVRPTDSTNRRELLGVPALQWVAPTGKLYNHVWGNTVTPDTVVAGTRQGWRMRIAAGYF